MRLYVYAFIISVLLSVIFSTGWYVLFDYDHLKSIPEYILVIYKNIYFWRGVAIWTLLYAVFFTLPIAFLRNKRSED